MKRMLTVVTILMLCVPLGNAASAAEMAGTKGMDSVVKHHEAIKSYQEEADVLNAKIVKVRGFIATAEDKTYRDPKGLKRTHWRTLVGNWQRQLNDTTQQLAWHAEQLDALKASGDEAQASAEFN